MADENLFAVMVGGSIDRAQIELHDVRFVIGETIEDCFDDLRAQWWGTPKSLHIDAWGALQWADGYRIDLVPEPAPQSEKLWFVNLGGYDTDQFDELHYNTFVVAPDARAAKKRALDEMPKWKSPHRDTVYEVDGIIDVLASATEISDRAAVHIRLTADEEQRRFKFETRY
ncbi:MAG: DUF1543 domain-containing protein [Pseudomonadota bacterium]